MPNAETSIYRTSNTHKTALVSFIHSNHRKNIPYHSLDCNKIRQVDSIVVKNALVVSNACAGKTKVVVSLILAFIATKLFLNFAALGEEDPSGLIVIILDAVEVS